MLLNFCKKDLIKTIRCSVGECDGYSVNNLISNQGHQWQKGFMVDYFIKPPVTIFIEFICDVSLNHVIVWPSVGSQKSTGIELSVGSDETHPTYLISGCIKTYENGFLFCKYDDACAKQKVPESFSIFSFNSSKHLRTKILKVKIFKTFASSVPALQKIEVWGEIPIDCRMQFSSIIKNICAGISDCKDVKETKIINTSNETLEYTNSKTPILVEHLQIPEEFIDPITSDIMKIPMILPSGNIVDNSSIEKFVNEEAKWGRLPSDPFTGKLFSDSSKPKVSIDLKARIDKFLVKHCNEPSFKILGRTLGNNSNGPKVSCLVSSPAAINKHKHSQGALKTISTDSCSLKKRKCESDFIGACGKTHEQDLDISKKLPNSENLVTPSLNCKSYDKLKEKSLDSILRSTLSNLPSFMNFTKSKNNVESCAECAADLNLYELPCMHYICRTCLSTMITTNNCKCSKCLQCFSSGDPKKVHLL